MPTNEFDMVKLPSIGDKYKPCDGSQYRIIVYKVENNQVFYHLANYPSKMWDKDVWMFNVRYELDAK